MVKSGAKLSLQMHHHRAEHWIVVSGEAIVTCDDNNFPLIANQATFIPLGARHRPENPAAESLHLIEVQFGSYLGETISYALTTAMAACRRSRRADRSGQDRLAFPDFQQQK
jgi:mannose-6-phosphate isomerase-like protein (cupin superfamily)